jgi:hypothetical protein
MLYCIDMVIKQSIYSKRRPYQFGDATRRFIEANPVTESRGRVPWCTPAEDLGQWPSEGDSVGTKVL